ncbi:flagellar protein FlaG [Alteromonas sp. RKMC-009]|uniref:flagellar protein FlaG n=1 Tax=Alteromonas sp. RKMC-009 TaxID=2267264 RepID=UPI001E5730DC|nr:flagellar protein FlaG [Alteromonas sp. RKMC-009]
MEIANLQVGQNFAASNLTEVQSQRVQTPAPANQNASATDKQQEERNSSRNAQGVTDAADIVSIEGQAQQDIEVAAREVEAFLQVQNRNLAFSVDENTNRSVVTVKDSESGDVIRQIPSDEVLKLAERIKTLQEDVGSSVGVLVNNKV